MSVPPLGEIAARPTAADAVRDHLLALIESGRMPPGSKLPAEHAMAERFRVSRPVVREALGALRATGVLESRTGSGTFVRASHPSAVVLLLGRYSSGHLHEVRVQLEVPGAGLAARRRTVEHLHRLGEILVRHEGCTDVEEWVNEDLAFHVTLAEATGNPVLARLVSELRELQREQSRVMAGASGGALRAPDEEHRAILDAVAQRDETAARQAMAAHLAAILDRWESTDPGEVRPDAA